MAGTEKGLVTDAMVEAAALGYLKTSSKAGDRIDREPMRAALEAALDLQVGPSGSKDLELEDTPEPEDAAPSSDELRDRIAEALWRHDAQIDFPQAGWASEAVMAVLREEGLLP